MQILVVDDDPVCRAMLAAAVRRVRHEPLEAADGEEAWERYRDVRPRIVLTDWLMPKLTGVELCARIREVADPRATYLILVTSMSAREDTLAGFCAGADDYVAKPVEIDVFAARLRAAMRVVEGLAAEEEMVHRRVVEACQGTIGAEHPELMPSLEALRKIYEERRAFAKARAFLRRQIAVARGAGDTETTDRLTRTLADIQDREDAALEITDGVPAVTEVA
jgi:DNA-binding response OmpR family regulator